MNFKSILIGAAFAIAAPFAASASTVVDICDDSGVQDVFPVIPTGDHDIFNCQFNDTTPASGMFAYEFEGNPTPISAFATNIQLRSASGDISGVTGTLSWWESDGSGNLVSLIDSTPLILTLGFGFGAELATTFSGPAPDYQSVVVSWSGFSGPLLDVNMTVEQVVPLPAGILLMGTALAGFGVMRRRKKAA